MLNCRLIFIGDPATFGLIGLSLSAIIFGAYQSRALYFHNSSQTDEEGSQTPQSPPLLGKNKRKINQTYSSFNDIFY